jgi:hypothetical protein
MTDKTELKICKMCSMSIPESARKCPHCQHFQSRVSMFMFHPAFGIIFVLIPMFILLAVFSKEYSQQIEIIESEIKFGVLRGEPSVAVIGTINNSSPIPWKAICFQVEFVDEKGVKSDTGQKEELYGYRVPSGEEQSFKVSFPREFPEENYVGHTIRIISAKDARVIW